MFVWNVKFCQKTFKLNHNISRRSRSKNWSNMLSCWLFDPPSFSQHVLASTQHWYLNTCIRLDLDSSEPDLDSPTHGNNKRLYSELKGQHESRFQILARSFYRGLRALNPQNFIFYFFVWSEKSVFFPDLRSNKKYVRFQFWFQFSRRYLRSQSKNFSDLKQNIVVFMFNGPIGSMLACGSSDPSLNPGKGHNLF